MSIRKRDRRIGVESVAVTLFKILNRLVLSVESMVAGDQHAVAKSQTRAVEALSNQQLAMNQMALQRIEESKKAQENTVPGEKTPKLTKS